MLKTFLLCAVILISAPIHAQNLKAEFEKKTDTIPSDAKKEITATFTVKVPMQPAFEGAKVSWSIEDTDVSLGASELFLPSGRDVTVSKDKDGEVKFSIKFQRNNKTDRIIKLKLTAKKANGETIDIDTALLREYIIYIRPFTENPALVKKKEGYELWLSTGTNLDLIDGIKAKDLYFKANYLANIKKGSKSSRSWINIDFGRNRYFSSTDSLNGIHFVQGLPPVHQDSIRLASGYYNTVKKIETNNIFLDIYYMWHIREFSSETSKLFLTLGFSLNSQTIKTTYANSVTASDTLSYASGQQLPIETSSPMFRNSTLRQNNKSLGYGFVYILDEDKINIKTSLLVGWNNFVYPSFIRYNGDAVIEERYKSEPTFYTRFRFEGTVLNPGLSLGFEAFLRGGQNPLYNVTLTKTIDFEQLGTLFGTLPTATKSK